MRKIYFLFFILLLSNVNAQNDSVNFVLKKFTSEMIDHEKFMKYYCAKEIPRSIKNKLKYIDKNIALSNPGQNYNFMDVPRWQDRFHKNRELIFVYKSNDIAVVHYYFNGVKIKRRHLTLICFYNKEDALIVSVGVYFQNISELYLNIISNNFVISKWI